MPEFPNLPMAEPNFYYYLDPRLVLDMTGISQQTVAKFDRPLHAEQWRAHPDRPAMMLFHDRDIALQPDFIDRLFDALPPDYKTVSANQLIGYEHAQVDSASADGGLSCSAIMNPIAIIPEPRFVVEHLAFRLPPRKLTISSQLGCFHRWEATRHTEHD